MSDQPAPPRRPRRVPSPAAAIALVAAERSPPASRWRRSPGPEASTAATARDRRPAAGRRRRPCELRRPNVLLPLSQTGPPGAAGAAGPAGAPGPSTACVTEQGGGITPTDKSLSLKKTTGTILALNLPAGARYLVNAKLSASLLGPAPRRWRAGSTPAAPTTSRSCGRGSRPDRPPPVPRGADLADPLDAALACPRGGRVPAGPAALHQIVRRGAAGRREADGPARRRRGAPARRHPPAGGEGGQPGRRERVAFAAAGHHHLKGARRGDFHGLEVPHRRRGGERAQHARAPPVGGAHHGPGRGDRDLARGQEEAQDAAPQRPYGRRRPRRRLLGLPLRPDLLRPPAGDGRGGRDGGPGRRSRTSASTRASSRRCGRRSRRGPRPSS